MKKLFILYFIMLLVGGVAENKMTPTKPLDEAEVKLLEEEDKDLNKMLIPRRRYASKIGSNLIKAKA